MSEPKTTSKKNIFYLLIPVLFVIFAIIAVCLLYYSFYAPTSQEKVKYAMTLALSGAFIAPIIFLLFIHGLNYIRIRKIVGGDYFVRWEYQKGLGKGDVYFCNEGVYDSDKTYRALDTFGSKFLGAEIPSDNPSIIRFSSLQLTGNRSFTQTKQTQEVPIPLGKEDEAEELVRRFRDYHGKSSKHTKDQWRYVFPMLGLILVWFFCCYQFIVSPISYEMKREQNEQQKERVEARLQKRTEQITPLWTKIRQTIEPQIEHLRTLPNGQLSAKEAGFDENSEVKTVLHGRCPATNDFYVSVVLKQVAVERDSTLFASETISGAFNYTTSRMVPSIILAEFCRPPIQERFDGRISLSSRWLYGEINISPLLETPSPTVDRKIKDAK